MPEIADKIKEFIKEKPAVAGAIGIGAIGGLYLLSRSGGSGLSLNSPLPTDSAAAQQPGQQPGQGGGDGSDVAALANQLAEQSTQTANWQSKIEGAFAALVDQLNNAIGQSNAQNQAGLNALAQQTNAALSSLGQPQTAGFNGFDSQLAAGLQQEIESLRTAFTGQVQQYQYSSYAPTPLPTIAPIKITIPPVTQVANQAGNVLGSIFGDLAKSYQVYQAPVVQPAYNAGVNAGKTANQLAQAFAQSINKIQAQVVNTPSVTPKIVYGGVDPSKKVVQIVNKMSAKA